MVRPGRAVLNEGGDVFGVAVGGGGEATVGAVSPPVPVAEARRVGPRVGAAAGPLVRGLFF